MFSNKSLQAATALSLIMGGGAFAETITIATVRV